MCWSFLGNERFEILICFYFKSNQMITGNLKNEIAALQSQIRLTQLMYSQMVKNNAAFAQLKPLHEKLNKLRTLFKEKRKELDSLRLHIKNNLN